MRYLFAPQHIFASSLPRDKYIHTIIGGNDVQLFEKIVW